MLFEMQNMGKRHNYIFNGLSIITLQGFFNQTEGARILQNDALNGENHSNEDFFYIAFYICDYF